MRATQITLFAIRWLALPCHIAEATLHTLFVSSHKTPNMFILSYDDQTNDIQLERSVQAHGGHPWMTLNHDRSVMYGAERDGWSSYQVNSTYGFQFRKYIPIGNTCGNANVRSGDTVMEVSKHPPYSVYGASRSPCGFVLTTLPDGQLDRAVQTISYNPDSRVQSMAEDRRGRYLISADTRDNGLWVHRIEPRTGRLDRGEVLDFPVPDARPRRIVLHPGGRFLYVLLQKLNRVAVFEVIEPRNNDNKPVIRFTNTTISLIPSSNVDQTKLRATDLHISEDGRVLYGTVRWRERNRDRDNGNDDAWEFEILRADSETQVSGTRRYASGNETLEEYVLRNTQTVLEQAEPNEVRSDIATVSRMQSPGSGFITAVLLASSPDLAIDGTPMSVLMQVATGTTGGRSNVITPAPWNPGHFALMDSERGLVQIWRLDGLNTLPLSGPLGTFQTLGNRPVPPGYEALRVNIVAEWRAPREAVGNPSVRENRGGDSRLDYPSVPLPKGRTPGQADIPARAQGANGAVNPDGYKYWEGPLQKRQNDEWRSWTGWKSQPRPTPRPNPGPQVPANYPPSTPSPPLLPSPVLPAGAIPSGQGCCANAVWID